MENTMRYKGRERTEEWLVRNAYGGGSGAALKLAAKVTGAVESLDPQRIRWAARDASILAREGVKHAYSAAARQVREGVNSSLQPNENLRQAYCTKRGLLQGAKTAGLTLAIYASLC